MSYQIYSLRGDYKGRAVYFMERMRKGGAGFAWDNPTVYAKVFPTEKSALKYLEKYRDRFCQTGFKAEHIVSAA